MNEFYLVIYTDEKSVKYIDTKNNPRIKIIIKPVDQFYTYKYKELWIKNHKKNKLLNTFFKIKQDDSANINQNKTNNIVQKYLSNIDDTFIDVNSFICQTDVCQICHKGELIPLEDEGLLICNVCFRSIPYLIENEKPSYKEPPKEVCFYAYKRINHFRILFK